VFEECQQTGRHVHVLLEVLVRLDDGHRLLKGDRLSSKFRTSPDVQQTAIEYDSDIDWSSDDE